MRKKQFGNRVISVLTVFALILSTLTVSAFGAERSSSVLPSGYDLRPIRIMMMGDGLTVGSSSNLSTDYMGYRAPIQRALIAAGIDYEMVGSLSSGNVNKYGIRHEGHTGWRIDALITGTKKLLSSKTSVLSVSPPDVIMLNIGMSDITQNYILGAAMTRYNELLNVLHTGLPGTKILISTLIDSTNSTYQKRISTFNASLRGLIAQWGGDVSLVEFSGILDVKKDYASSVLPNDKGYSKLAVAWNYALAGHLSYGGASKLAQQPLRVMALGSSVTYGTGSSAVNANAGYRGFLQRYFDQAGLLYDMVGSIRQGNRNLIDTDVEGHYGYRIDQIASGVPRWLADNPANLVILHTGGNDMNQNYKVNQAPERLDSLINLIRSNSPQGVKIVVCTLLDTSNVGMQARVKEYNRGVRQVVAKQYERYGDVWLAEMEGLINVKTDLSDSLHPNAKGYAKMSASLLDALAQFMPEMKGVTP